MAINVKESLANIGALAEQLENNEKNSREVRQVGVVLSSLVLIVDEQERRLRIFEERFGTHK